MEEKKDEIQKEQQKQEDCEILLIDEEDRPAITVREAESFKPILKDFVETYAAHPDEEVQTWLTPKLASYLPDKSDKEINQISNDIVKSLDIAEEKKASLAKAKAEGISTQGWFAKECQKAVSGMTTVDAAKYLQGLDNVVTQANAKILETVTIQSGLVSQSPVLDGYIAEQYHAQTFNMNAEALGSHLRAEVVEPTNGFTENGWDIVVKNENGDIIQHYQSKYCKDPISTIKAFFNGDYRGQQKLVPADQKEIISKVMKCTDRLNCKGVTSTPLTKDAAKQMQIDAQAGKKDFVNWNDFDTTKLSLGIANKAVTSAAMGVAITVGVDVAAKVFSGEDIDGKEVVANAIETGVDCGVKTAAAGALKVASEKGLIAVLPPGTPAATVANVAFVGIEDLKIAAKVAKGELTVMQGLDQMVDTTVSATAGLICAAEGAATGAGVGAGVGAAIGSVFGPVGTLVGGVDGSAVGGLTGGAVGYFAGSKLGHWCYQGVKAVAKTAVNVAKKIGSGLKNIGSKISSGLKSFASGVKSFFGW